MRISIPYVPRRWQYKSHTNMRRFNVLVLHRRAGKTELALMELLDRAMVFEKELGMFVYVAPQLKQAKAVAWARLKQIIKPLIVSGHITVNEGELSIVFKHNGAVIRLFGADNPDALRGLRLDFGVLDEVAQMKPEVWFEVIRPALADRLGGALFIGTVKGVDLFSQIYHQGLERMADGADWFVGLWTCYETDALSPEEIEEMRESMSEQAFAREMLCDFSAQGDDQLISLNDVHLSAARTYTAADIAAAPVVLGVDGARFGNDRSVIVRRQGLQMFEPIVMRNLDNMQLAARVSQEIEQHHPAAVFIDAADAGVIDRLRQLHYQITEVPFGGKASKEELYINKRTEIWFRTRDWLQAGGAIVNNLALKQELATPVYMFDAKGRFKLESKDDIRERLPDAGSPDIGDGLALTFAADVAPPPVHVEYDPTHPFAPPVAMRPRGESRSRSNYHPMDHWRRNRR
tara:strand:+ start:4723 stop:6105 length:1383 start_codon:yes stop_codon:yes gene_type:complete